MAFKSSFSVKSLYLSPKIGNSLKSHCTLSLNKSTKIWRLDKGVFALYILTYETQIKWH